MVFCSIIFILIRFLSFSQYIRLRLFFSLHMILIEKFYFTSKNNYHKKIGTHSVGNHFFQTLAKMANGLKQVLTKMK
jgi:hypothetical protein